MINIYRLLDPETLKTRYIGQTIQVPKRRLGRGYGKTHTANWVKSLKKRGLTPIIELEWQADSQEEADFLEVLLIRYYRSIGCDLTNDRDGGKVTRGWRHTKETCAKVSASLTGKKHTAEHCANMGASKKGKPMPEGFGARVSATLTGRPGIKLGKMYIKKTRDRVSGSNLGITRLDERGEKNGSCKLSEEQVVCAMARMLCGEAQTSIARELGVSKSTIHSIWTGRIWGYLFDKEFV